MQKQKRLKIGGVSQTLPPSLSPDGESSCMVNLRCDNGVWRPVGRPRVVYTPTDASHRLIHIHVNEDYKHLFTYDGVTLYFEAEESDGRWVPIAIPANFDLPGVSRVESLGNTLVVFTDEAIYYLYYTEGEYRLLGSRPEFPELSFSLGDATTRTEEWNNYTLVTPLVSDNGYRLSDSDKTRFSSLVYGTYSRARSSLLDDGYMSYPFMVRYALRLYDDSYIYPSPPVLLCPSRKAAFDNNLGTICKEKDDELTMLYHAAISLTGEKVRYTVHAADLEAWRDVVKGVDIFFSRELPVVRDAAIEEGYTISKEKDADGNDCKVLRFALPLMADNEQREMVINEALFYKVASIDIDEFQADADKVMALTYTCSLANLVHQRTLPLDNFSLHTLYAQESYVYNGRLHLGDVATRFYEGYPLALYEVRQESYLDNALSDFHIEYGYVRATLKGTSQAHVVSFIRGGNYRLSSYYSYPDTRAVTLEIVGYGSSGDLVCYHRLPLKIAPNENRAYYLTPDLAPLSLSVTETLPDDVSFVQDNIVEYTPGKMRVSAPYNPFVFPQENTYVVSSGKILAMVAATAALSQGQYGEFPLYVFTTDGIWTMQQGEGAILYAACHPINREVALSSRHIVSVDDAALYLSEQGLMALTGSEVKLLSTPFDGVPDTLPTNISQGNVTTTDILYDMQSSGEFLRNAVVGYNYTMKELCFMREGYRYMWVYDLTQTRWSCRMAEYVAFHTLYPVLLAVDNEGRVYDMCDERTDEPVEVAWVSRAVKILPDVPLRLPRCVWRCNGDAVSLDVSVWAANRAEEGYGRVAGVSVAGDIPGRIPMRIAAPAYRYHRFALLGSVSPDFHLDAIDVEYK